MPSLRLLHLRWRAGDLEHRLPDLTLEPGQAVVVAAEPEAGEALADVVVGLARPLGGRIRRDDQDVTALAPRERGIALVPAGGGLLPHVNVRRNVGYGGDPARAGDWLRALQLESLEKRSPHELSPAQRLQVAVARALCQNPPPTAIVVEDRSGAAPYGAAVQSARANHLAVLVITDTERGAGLGGVVKVRSDET